MSLAVENSLEDWMGLYNSIIKVTLLPYPPLELELPQLRLRCDARDDYMLLVPRRIKMVRLEFVRLLDVGAGCWHCLHSVAAAAVSLCVCMCIYIYTFIHIYIVQLYL